MIGCLSFSESYPARLHPKKKAATRNSSGSFKFTDEAVLQEKSSDLEASYLSSPDGVAVGAAVGAAGEAGTG